MKNKNLYALVTGSTKGIGRHMVEVLAEEGYSLVIIARNAADLDDLSTDIKSRFSVDVIVIEADLCNADVAFVIHRDITNQNLKIAIMANSVAGQGNFQEFLQADLKKEIEIIQFNIMNFVVLARLFLPDMIERKNGKVISLAACDKVDERLRSVYLASIAFLDSFVSTIGVELEHTGVSVTTIRSAASAENVFRKGEKKVAYDVDQRRLRKNTYSDRDGYDSFMRGD
jgi:short-subunit dehydrogenase